MRPLKELDRYRFEKWERRIAGGVTLTEDEKNSAGAFAIMSESKNHILMVMAVSGAGWDHLSVSCVGKMLPTWTEMEQIKRMFFKPDEVAMQLHVAVADHINNNPGVLHLWRPHSKIKKIPLPPKNMV